MERSQAIDGKKTKDAGSKVEKEEVTRKTKDGKYQISASSIKRLERQLKADKEEVSSSPYLRIPQTVNYIQYDSLKIKQLTRHGQTESDTNKKNEESKLQSLRQMIR